MISRLALTEDLGIKNIFKTSSYYRRFYKENPTYFKPDGLICFIGSQGSGKSLSAVNYVYNLLYMYPKSIIVTNLKLTDYEIDEKRVFEFKVAKDILKYKNGINGVIFLIDEIHLYFGSQKGNNNLDPAVLQEICQQRKQRIHIVATTQYFGQLNIALRRHFDSLIYCKSYLRGYLQINSLINKSSLETDDSSGQVLKAKIIKKFYFFRSPDMFKRYDTLAVIDNKNLNVGVRKESFDYGS
ncbi:MAG: AAA family ATPase [Bacilli bacterium]|jgi:hypothetical protein|nr:AAA family ATPase [Bacilli bacterium]